MYDYTQADLDRPTRAMLDFAVKLTRQPSSMEESDIELLRQAGLDDQQILSTVLIGCTFNFMTRLADGLGVEVDPDQDEEVLSWLTGPAREYKWLFTRSPARG